MFFQATRRACAAASQSVWKPYFQFQSHEPSFDFLKSLPIEEKINQIEFSQAVRDGVLLLTTNGAHAHAHVAPCQAPASSHHPRNLISSLRVRVCACVDKTVKLWKVNHRAPFTPRAVTAVERQKQAGGQPSSSSLRLPTAVLGRPRLPTASPRAVFENAHAYNINALSANSDGRTFLSADDLRIHWWDLEVRPFLGPI